MKFKGYIKFYNLKKESAFLLVQVPISSRLMPLKFAMNSAVFFTCIGSHLLPRNGTGAK